MKPIFALALGVILALPGHAQETAETDPQGDDEAPALIVLDAAEADLAEYLWLKRPIVVMADTPADPRLQQQIELLMERPGELIARDVVIIVDADPSTLSDIRRKLRPRGFMLALIGKDGRVNLRKPFPWDVREISRAIDKWPLRQQEIRTAKERAARQPAVPDPVQEIGQ